MLLKPLLIHEFSVCIDRSGRCIEPFSHFVDDRKVVGRNVMLLRRRKRAVARELSGNRKRHALNAQSSYEGSPQVVKGQPFDPCKPQGRRPTSLEVIEREYPPFLAEVRQCQKLSFEPVPERNIASSLRLCMKALNVYEVPVEVDVLPFERQYFIASQACIKPKQYRGL